MNSVHETPMVRVACTTQNPVLSADICNSVLQVAPSAIKDVVTAGEAKAQDYATIPMFANARSDRKSGLIHAARVLRDVPGISINYFDEKDVVRHELVGAIIKAYEQYEQKPDEKKAEETRQQHEH